MNLIPWRVEIAPGADLSNPVSWQWQDITADVRQVDGVSIEYGRKDEWTQVSATTCELTLDNRDSQHSNLARNTPLRVRYGDADNSRFVGYVASRSPRFDRSENDATVPVEAAGIRRRLSQGTKALHSSLYRRAVSSGPVAYWPLEDGRNATEAGSSIEGVRPALIKGEVDFSTADGPGGSDRVATIREGAEIYTRVPDRSGFSSWQVEWIFNLDEGPADYEQWITVQSTGTGHQYRLEVDAGSFRFHVVDFEGDTISDFTFAAEDFFARWTRFRLTAEQDGGDIHWKLTWIDVAESTLHSHEGTFAGTVGHPTRVFSDFGPGFDGMGLGHIVVWNGRFDDNPLFDADEGFPGELAGHRLERICDEEGIPFTVTSDHIDTAPMGPQPIDTVLNVLDECAAADGGALLEFEGGLAYQSRRDRANQGTALVLDHPSGEAADPPQPIKDDQRTVNDFTASRVGGTSARVVDRESRTVAQYDSSLDVNVEKDSQLADIARWNVHLGTAGDMRWPVITMRLHHTTSLIPDWLAFQFGQRLRLDHEIAQLVGQGVDVLVDGWRERFDQVSWEAELNCVPARPWDVGVIGDDDLGRADTEGAQLDAGIDGSQTSFDVETTTGAVWVNDTDDGDEFPFDIRAGGVDGGEVMTVTGISGESSPQTFTVERSVNSVETSHDAGTDVRLATSMILE